MTWRFHAQDDVLGRVTIRGGLQLDSDSFVALQPQAYVLEAQDAAATVEPWLHLERAAATELYEALGKCLGAYTDGAQTRDLREALDKERERVDKFISYLTDPM